MNNKIILVTFFLAFASSLRLTTNLNLGYDPITEESKYPVFADTFKEGNSVYHPYHDTLAEVADGDSVVFAFSYDAGAAVVAYGALLKVAQIRNSEAAYNATFYGAAEEAMVAVAGEQLAVFVAISGSKDLSPEIMKDLKNLPVDMDELQYADFIQKYGTEVVVEAVFGGWIKAWAFAAAAVQAGAVVEGTRSAEEAAQELATQLSANLTAASTDQGAAFKEGAAVAAIGVHAAGGFFASIDRKDEWVQSVPKSPVMIEANTKDITSVLPACAQTENLKIAIAAYVAPNEDVQTESK